MWCAPCYGALFSFLGTAGQAAFFSTEPFFPADYRAGCWDELWRRWVHFYLWPAQPRPRLKGRFLFFERATVGELMSTGSWITVQQPGWSANWCTPDRFVISALLSVSVVAYYTTSV